MKIGKWQFGIRSNSRKQFYWFYRPLMRSTEEREGLLIWWFGWHFYVAYTFK